MRKCISVKKKKYAKWGIFFLFLLWLTLISWWIQIKSYPSINSMAQSQVNHRINDWITNDTYNKINYSSLVTIRYDKDGQIQTIQAQMAKINQIKNELVQSFLQQEANRQGVDLSIPIGNLIQHPLFYGKGPCFHAKIMPCSNISAVITDSFTSAGVNQTLHSIYIEINASGEILSASGKQKYSFNDRILLCQTLIVGKVPSVSLQGGLLGNTSTTSWMAKE